MNKIEWKMFRVPIYPLTPSPLSVFSPFFMYQLYNFGHDWATELNWTIQLLELFLVIVLTL